MRDSDWVEDVELAFSSSGALGAANLRFQPRVAQTDMALAVARAIREKRPLVVEAGTGVGKTYAYLVPVLLSGARALISTATKSLQDQLFLRDIPQLSQALQWPVRVALLKGRSSYLCSHRLRHARTALGVGDFRAHQALTRIEVWAQATPSGDFAEIEGLEERSPVMGLVSSTRDNCLGGECPEFKSCHVARARRDALAADIVVVNHHLFFADMAIRESGMAELLPTVDVVVLDEAHQLVSAGLQFLGTHLGTATLGDMARDLKVVAPMHAQGLAPWALLAAALDRSARLLIQACAISTHHHATRLRWDELSVRPTFHAAMAEVVGACDAAAEALTAVKAAAPELARLLERVLETKQRANALQGDVPAGKVRWAEQTRHHVRVLESPLDLRAAMQSTWAQEGKAWIFASATLGDDEHLSWFTRPMGLDQVKTCQFPSPFDYPHVARLYIPRHFPEAGSRDHPFAVAALAQRLAMPLQGRTFVLTTTLRALEVIASALRQGLTSEHSSLQVLVQGASPKRQLLQQFLAQPTSILVGSHSFWEGIDVPGDALQCVLIDKLPFPPPNDAIVEARVQALKTQGRDAFGEVFLAETAIALKQGAGRLIRSESDRGLLVVCDSRLLTMRYGARLRRAMPPAPVLLTESDTLAYLGGLAERGRVSVRRG